jgi:histone-lysine N-methyltransferase SETMAR
MDISKSQLRVRMLHEFDLGHTATEATRNICAALGEQALSVRTCQRWFKRFRSGEAKPEDRSRDGRPQAIDSAVLLHAIKVEPTKSIRELAGEFHCSYQTIANHLHQLGKVNRHRRWEPHELSASDKHRRMDICASLIRRQKGCSFLNRLVTGDETWVLYENQSRKNQWLSPGEAAQPTPKQSMHQRKVLLCVWWTAKGVTYFELLESGQIVNADLY